MLKGIIFDCDGVLFNSHAANLAYYNHILGDLGHPLVVEGSSEAQICHTAASPEVFRILLGESRRDEALEAAENVDYRIFIPLMHPEPGMHETIAELSEKHPLGIATNRGRSMPELLEHFGLARYFSAVVTCRDVARPKPAPDMVSRAVDLLGGERERFLFVGDSELDYRAASGAGVPFVAYKWDCGGAGSYRADSFRQLHELTQEIVRRGFSPSPEQNRAPRGGR